MTKSKDKTFFKIILSAIRDILSVVTNNIQLFLAIFIILAIYIYAQKDTVGIFAHYLVILLAFFIVAIVGFLCRGQVREMQEIIKQKESLLKIKEQQLEEERRQLEEKAKMLDYMRKIEESYKNIFREMNQ